MVRTWGGSSFSGLLLEGLTISQEAQGVGVLKRETSPGPSLLVSIQGSAHARNRLAIPRILSEKLLDIVTEILE